VDLIDNGKVYFLSRPRRFGKSLTISTFEALFSGKKDLFHGLEAEGFFERKNYGTFPVVQLDMSKVIPQDNNTLLNSMTLQVMRSAERYGVKIIDLALKNPATALSAVIKGLSIN
jgi:hypothetical protein